MAQAFGEVSPSWGSFSMGKSRCAFLAKLTQGLGGDIIRTAAIVGKTQVGHHPQAGVPKKVEVGDGPTGHGKAKPA